MVDGGDEPGQAQAKEYIHRVASRHVPDGIISVFFLKGGRLRSKGVGQWGTQGNERDGWGGIILINVRVLQSFLL